MIILLI
jgi:hypothetical protein